MLKQLADQKVKKKVFSSVITIMASNNFCPALVDTLVKNLTGSLRIFKD